MRTTLTIDDELFQVLREEAARTRRSLRDVINERLRLALKAPTRHSSKFKVEPFDSKGFAPGVDENKLNQLYDTLEAEDASRNR